MRNRLAVAVIVTAVLSGMCGIRAEGESGCPPTTEEERIRRTGGLVLKPGCFAGNVRILDAQTRLAREEIEKAVSLLAAETELNFTVADGSATNLAEMVRTSGITAVLAVVDDPGEPVLLVAPEERWAKVNVARIVDDLPAERAKEKFFAPRTRKEILKGLSLLCGGGISQFPGFPMDAANVRELDLCREAVPIDKLSNMLVYLEKLGMTKKEFATYKRACREGWAPAPTNEIQRAIWEQIRSEKELGPSNALKIEPKGK